MQANTIILLSIIHLCCVDVICISFQFQNKQKIDNILKNEPIHFTHVFPINPKFCFITNTLFIKHSPLLCFSSFLSKILYIPSISHHFTKFTIFSSQVSTKNDKSYCKIIFSVNKRDHKMSLLKELNPSYGL